MMELIKQLRLSTSDSKCYLQSSNNFHFNLNGALSDLFSGKERIFTRLRHMSISSIARKITFSLYYGPSVNYMKDVDVKTVTIIYTSYEELCFRLMHEANCLIKSDSCTYTTSDHSNHICDGVRESDLLRLHYENDIFKLVNGPGCITILTCNVLKIMKFSSYILDSFSAHEIDAMGETEAIESCLKPIKLEGRILIGTPVKFYNDWSRYCHVLVDGLVYDTFVFDSIRYPVLGTYCMNKGELDMGTENTSIVKVISPIRDQISLSLVNDRFEPFDFENGKALVSIMFTLDFYHVV